MELMMSIGDNNFHLITAVNAFSVTVDPLSDF